MATEAEIRESVPITEVELESKYLTSKVHDGVVDELMLGEFKKINVGDAHEFSKQTDNVEIASDLPGESVNEKDTSIFGNSEGECFSESPSVADLSHKDAAEENRTPNEEILLPNELAEINEAKIVNKVSNDPDCVLVSSLSSEEEEEDETKEPEKIDFITADEGNLTEEASQSSATETSPSPVEISSEVSILKEAESLEEGVNKLPPIEASPVDKNEISSVSLCSENTNDTELFTVKECEDDLKQNRDKTEIGEILDTPIECPQTEGESLNPTDEEISEQDSEQISHILDASLVEQEKSLQDQGENLNEVETSTADENGNEETSVENVERESQEIETVVLNTDNLDQGTVHDLDEIIEKEDKIEENQVQEILESSEVVTDTLKEEIAQTQKEEEPEKDILSNKVARTAEDKDYGEPEKEMHDEDNTTTCIRDDLKEETNIEHLLSEDAVKDDEKEESFERSDTVSVNDIVPQDHIQDGDEAYVQGLEKTPEKEGNSEDSLVEDDEVMKVLEDSEGNEAVMHIATSLEEGVKSQNLEETVDQKSKEGTLLETSSALCVEEESEKVEVYAENNDLMPEEVQDRTRTTGIEEVTDGQVITRPINEEADPSSREGEKEAKISEQEDSEEEILYQINTNDVNPDTVEGDTEQVEKDADPIGSLVDNDEGDVQDLEETREKESNSEEISVEDDNVKNVPEDSEGNEAIMQIAESLDKEENTEDSSEKDEEVLKEPEQFGSTESVTPVVGDSEGTASQNFEEIIEKEENNEHSSKEDDSVAKVPEEANIEHLLSEDAVKDDEKGESFERSDTVSVNDTVPQGQIQDGDEADVQVLEKTPEKEGNSKDSLVEDDGVMKVLEDSEDNEAVMHIATSLEEGVSQNLEETVEQKSREGTLSETSSVLCVEEESEKVEVYAENNDLMTEEVQDGTRTTGIEEVTDGQVITEPINEEADPSSSECEKEAKISEQEDSEEEILYQINTNDVNSDAVEGDTEQVEKDAEPIGSLADDDEGDVQDFEETREIESNSEEISVEDNNVKKVPEEDSEGNEAIMQIAESLDKEENTEDSSKKDEEVLKEPEQFESTESVTPVVGDSDGTASQNFEEIIEKEENNEHSFKEDDSIAKVLEDPVSTEAVTSAASNLDEEEDRSLEKFEENTEESDKQDNQAVIVPEITEDTEVVTREIQVVNMPENSECAEPVTLIAGNLEEEAGQSLEQIQEKGDDTGEDFEQGDQVTNEPENSESTEAVTPIASNFEKVADGTENSEDTAMVTQTASHFEETLKKEDYTDESKQDDIVENPINASEEVPSVADNLDRQVFQNLEGTLEKEEETATMVSKDVEGTNEVAPDFEGAECQNKVENVLEEFESVEAVTTITRNLEEEVVQNPEEKERNTEDSPKEGEVETVPKHSESDEAPITDNLEAESCQNLEEAIYEEDKTEESFKEGEKVEKVLEVSEGIESITPTTSDLEEGASQNLDGLDITQERENKDIENTEASLTSENFEAVRDFDETPKDEGKTEESYKGDDDNVEKTVKDSNIIDAVISHEDTLEANVIECEMTQNEDADETENTEAISIADKLEVENFDETASREEKTEQSSEEEDKDNVENLHEATKTVTSNDNVIMTTNLDATSDFEESLIQENNVEDNSEEENKEHKGEVQDGAQTTGIEEITDGQVLTRPINEEADPSSSECKKEAKIYEQEDSEEEIIYPINTNDVNSDAEPIGSLADNDEGDFQDFEETREKERNSEEISVEDDSVRKVPEDSEGDEAIMQIAESLDKEENTEDSSEKDEEVLKEPEQFESTESVTPVVGDSEVTASQNFEEIIEKEENNEHSSKEDDSVAKVLEDAVGTEAVTSAASNLDEEESRSLKNFKENTEESDKQDNQAVSLPEITEDTEVVTREIQVVNLPENSECAGPVTLIASNLEEEAGQSLEQIQEKEDDTGEGFEQDDQVTNEPENSESTEAVTPIARNFEKVADVTENSEDTAMVTQTASHFEETLEKEDYTDERGKQDDIVENPINVSEEVPSVADNLDGQLSQNLEETLEKEEETATMVSKDVEGTNEVAPDFEDAECQNKVETVLKEFESVESVTTITGNLEEEEVQNLEEKEHNTEDSSKEGEVETVPKHSESDEAPIIGNLEEEYCQNLEEAIYEEDNTEESFKEEEKVEKVLEVSEGIESISPTTSNLEEGASQNLDGLDIILERENKDIENTEASLTSENFEAVRDFDGNPNDEGKTEESYKEGDDNVEKTVRDSNVTDAVTSHEDTLKANVVECQMTQNEDAEETENTEVISIADKLEVKNFDEIPSREEKTEQSYEEEDNVENVHEVTETVTSNDNVIMTTNLDVTSDFEENLIQEKNVEDNSQEDNKEHKEEDCETSRTENVNVDENEDTQTSPVDINLEETALQNFDEAIDKEEKSDESSKEENLDNENNIEKRSEEDKKVPGTPKEEECEIMKIEDITKPNMEKSDMEKSEDSEVDRNAGNLEEEAAAQNLEETPNKEEKFEEEDNVENFEEEITQTSRTLEIEEQTEESINEDATDAKMSDNIEESVAVGPYARTIEENPVENLETPKEEEKTEESYEKDDNVKKTLEDSNVTKPIISNDDALEADVVDCEMIQTEGCTKKSIEDVDAEKTENSELVPIADKSEVQSFDETPNEEEKTEQRSNKVDNVEKVPEDPEVTQTITSNDNIELMTTSLEAPLDFEENLDQVRNSEEENKEPVTPKEEEFEMSQTENITEQSIEEVGDTEASPVGINLEETALQKFEEIINKEEKTGEISKEENLDNEKEISEEDNKVPMTTNKEECEMAQLEDVTQPIIETSDASKTEGTEATRSAANLEEAGEKNLEETPNEEEKFEKTSNEERDVEKIEEEITQTSRNLEIEEEILEKKTEESANEDAVDAKMSDDIEGHVVVGSYARTLEENPVESLETPNEEEKTEESYKEDDNVENTLEDSNVTETVTLNEDTFEANVVECETIQTEGIKNQNIEEDDAEKIENTETIPIANELEVQNHDESPSNEEKTETVTSNADNWVGEDTENLDDTVEHITPTADKFEERPVEEIMDKEKNIDENAEEDNKEQLTSKEEELETIQTESVTKQILEQDEEKTEYTEASPLSINLKEIAFRNIEEDNVGKVPKDFEVTETVTSNDESLEGKATENLDDRVENSEAIPATDNLESSEEDNKLLMAPNEEECEMMQTEDIAKLNMEKSDAEKTESTKANLDEAIANLAETPNKEEKFEEISIEEDNVEIMADESAVDDAATSNDHSLDAKGVKNLENKVEYIPQNSKATPEEYSPGERACLGEAEKIEEISKEDEVAPTNNEKDCETIIETEDIIKPNVDEDDVDKTETTEASQVANALQILKEIPNEEEKTETTEASPVAENLEESSVQILEETPNEEEITEITEASPIAEDLDESSVQIIDETPNKEEKIEEGLKEEDDVEKTPDNPDNTEAISSNNENLDRKAVENLDGDEEHMIKSLRASDNLAETPNKEEKFEENTIGEDNVEIMANESTVSDAATSNDRNLDGKGVENLENKVEYIPEDSKATPEVYSPGERACLGETEKIEEISTQDEVAPTNNEEDCETIIETEDIIKPNVDEDDVGKIETTEASPVANALQILEEIPNEEEKTETTEASPVAENLDESSVQILEETPNEDEMTEITEASPFAENLEESSVQILDEIPNKEETIEEGLKEEDNVEKMPDNPDDTESSNNENLDGKAVENLDGDEEHMIKSLPASDILKKMAFANFEENLDRESNIEESSKEDATMTITPKEQVCEELEPAVLRSSKEKLNTAEKYEEATKEDEYPVDDSVVSEVSEKDNKDEISGELDLKLNDSASASIIVERDGTSHGEAELGEKIPEESPSLGSREMSVEDEACENVEYERLDVTSEAQSDGLIEETTCETILKHSSEDDLEPSKEHELVINQTDETRDEIPQEAQAPSESIEEDYPRESSEIKSSGNEESTNLGFRNEKIEDGDTDIIEQRNFTEIFEESPDDVEVEKALADEGGLSSHEHEVANRVDDKNLVEVSNINSDMKREEEDTEETEKAVTWTEQVKEEIEKDDNKENIKEVIEEGNVAHEIDMVKDSSLVETTREAPVEISDPIQPTDEETGASGQGYVSKIQETEETVETIESLHAEKLDEIVREEDNVKHIHEEEEGTLEGAAQYKDIYEKVSKFESESIEAIQGDEIASDQAVEVQTLSSTLNFENEEKIIEAMEIEQDKDVNNEVCKEIGTGDAEEKITEQVSFGEKVVATIKEEAEQHKEINFADDPIPRDEESVVTKSQQETFEIPGEISQQDETPQVELENLHLTDSELNASNTEVISTEKQDNPSEKPGSGEEKTTESDPSLSTLSELIDRSSTQLQPTSEQLPTIGEKKTQTEELIQEDENGKTANEPVIVEASRDSDVEVAHKKSSNILSKVKHSIKKVKKAITGKSSSNTKPASPK